MIEKRNYSQKEESGLLRIFQRENLEKLLASMTEISGMSLFFIDYKGETVISSGIETAYCADVDNESSSCRECRTNLVLAAAKAAIKNEISLFRCPKGLVNMALPIVVDHQYLGALAGGRVRCEEQSAFPVLIQEENDFVGDRGKYMEIPVLTQKKIEALSKVFFFMLKEMGEKETLREQISTLERQEKHLSDMRKSNAYLKEKIEKKEQERLKAGLYPQFLLNFLVTISNYAILENASQTEEVIADLASVLRYYVDEDLEEVSVKQELSQIEKYLKTLKKQYDNRFDYIINCEEEAQWEKIPVLTIFPFVEYIINAGILPGHFKGKFYMDAEIDDGRLVIRMQLQSTDYLLTGGGMTGGKEYIVDESLLMEQIVNTEKRLLHVYEGDCHVVIHPDMIRLDMPENKKN